MATTLRDLDPSDEAPAGPSRLHALAALESLELALQDPRRLATSGHALRGALEVLRRALREPGTRRLGGPLPGGPLPGQPGGRRTSRRLKRLVRASDSPGDLAGLEEVLGRSPAWQKVLSIVARIADTPVTALLEGESGTGKEVLARVIHRTSHLAQAPFVAVNCGALPGPLLEAELFGHTKGAFTGATSERKGRFKEAHGGTLFLDEIGEIPVDLQAKLLRALQSGEVQRLGQDKVERVEVRVLAATNRDLPAMAREGLFREDLFYRLAAIRIQLPPLRERREEVLPLLEFFLSRYAAAYGRPVPELTPSVRAAVLTYRFPGNIRELENLAKHLVLLEELPPTLLAAPLAATSVSGGSGSVSGSTDGGSSPGPDGLGLVIPHDHDGLVAAKKALVSRLEREFVRAALARANGNVSQAARETGMNRAYLQRLAQEYR